MRIVKTEADSFRDLAIEVGVSKKLIERAVKENSHEGMWKALVQGKTPQEVESILKKLLTAEVDDYMRRKDVNNFLREPTLAKFALTDFVLKHGDFINEASARQYAGQDGSVESFFVASQMPSDVLGLFPEVIERIKEKFGLEAAVKDVLFAVVHAPVAQFISEKMIVKAADGLVTPETRPFLLNASKRGIQCRDEAFYKPIVDQAYLQIKEYKDPVLMQRVVDLGVRVNKVMTQSEKGKLLVDLQKIIDEVGKGSPSILVQVEKICEIAQQKNLIEVRHLDALKRNIRTISGQQESIFSVGDLLDRQHGSPPPGARAMVRSSSMNVSSERQSAENSSITTVINTRIEALAQKMEGMPGTKLASEINFICSRIEEITVDIQGSKQAEVLARNLQKLFVSADAKMSVADGKDALSARVNDLVEDLNKAPSSPRLH